jgi:glycosyltransferase involved in cell wall biosynthesis
LFELVPEFVRAGLEPEIAIFVARSSGIESNLEALGVRIHRIFATSGSGRVWAVRRLLEERRPHIVHSTLFPADVTVRLAALKRPVKVLTSLVNTSYDDARLRDPYLRRSRVHMAQMIDGFTARHMTDAFHAITHAVKDSAVRSLGIPESRVTVVERGRDPVRLGSRSDERRSRVRAELGIAPDAVVVINVARQEYQKGQRFLVEAFETVCATEPNALLLVVGREGHASADLRARVRGSSCGERIRFTGYRADVPDLLAAADVFAFPSVYEGFGGAVIEAMALELPVVASDIPAVREVLGSDDGAVLVDPENAGALACGLKTVIENPALARELGRRGRRRFEAHFTLERIAGRMLDMYRNLSQAS